MNFNKTYKAVDPLGNEVKPGDVIYDFRGDKYTFDCITRPAYPGKSAKVAVFTDPSLISSMEYYAGVFNLDIVPREENSNA
jgi:hypothetical protein